MGGWEVPAIRRSPLAVVLVLAATVLVLLSVAKAAHATSFTTFDSASAQVINGSSPTETNRPFRGGIASSCGHPNVPNTTAGTYHYRSHTHTSDLNNSVCVQVTLSTACSGTNQIFAQS